MTVINSDHEHAERRQAHEVAPEVLLRVLTDAAEREGIWKRHRWVVVAAGGILASSCAVTLSYIFGGLDGVSQWVVVITTVVTGAGTGAAAGAMAARRHRQIRQEVARAILADMRLHGSSTYVIPGLEDLRSEHEGHIYRLHPDR